MLKTSRLALLLPLLLLLSPTGASSAAFANEPRHVDVVFSIAQDGSLRWVKVLKCRSEFDREPSIDAIKQAAPFRPLPLEYGDHAEFKVSFDYWCTHRHDFSLERVREQNGTYISEGEKLPSCWKPRTDKFD
jgi:hypothetical protein